MTDADRMTDKRVAILHIGQPKAGSTSIQHAIAGYDDGSTFTATFRTFRKPNHSIPISTAFRSDFLNYHHWKSIGAGGEEIRRKRERFRAEFSAMLERRDRNRIIVTGEDIWPFESADKAELVEFIHRRGWEVRVVAYVREPAGLAASRLSQFIRILRIPTIPDLNPGYRHGLSAFMELLPPENLHVRPFDPNLLEGGHPVRDFCETVGLDPSGAEAIHANKSLSLPAMKLLFRFKKTEILDRYDSKLAAARRWLARTVGEKYDGLETLDSALCEGIADWSDTEWLYENFGIDFRRNRVAQDTGKSGRSVNKAGGRKHESANMVGLEAVLGDLSDVDLSGLDECLAEYGIAGENFPTAEQKLHRLFYVFVMLSGRIFLFNNPDRNLLKSFQYRALKRLSNSRLLSRAWREALTRKAHGVWER